MREIESAYPPVIEAIIQRLHIAEVNLTNVLQDSENPWAWSGCEIVALQLRLICELYLAGATIAHKIEGELDIRDDKWRPKDSFLQIESLSEHPLPFPVSIESRDNVSHHITPLSQPMNFASLNAVYGKCGDLLHVPTPRQVLSGRMPEYDTGALGRWLSGFKVLTMAHMLFLPKRERGLLCSWNGTVEHKPQLTRIEAKGESTLKLEDFPPFDLLG